MSASLSVMSKNILLSLVLCALASVSVADDHGSYGPPPSLGEENGSSPDQAPKQQQQQPATNGQDLGAPSSVKVTPRDQPSANDGNQSSGSEPPENWGTYAERAIAAFTFVIMVIAAFQAWYFRKQLRLMREEFNAANQPLLKVRFVRILKEGGGPMTVEYGVVNSGHSVATVTGSAVYAKVMDRGDWPSPHDYGLNGHVTRESFYPGNTDRFTIETGCSWADLESMENDQRRLRLYGWITYEAPAKNVRTTYFCREYDRSKSRFFGPSDEDYDTTD